MAEASVLVASPRLTDERSRALLRGVVPCFDVALSTSYGHGVRSVAPEATASASVEELRSSELPSLLSAPAPLGLLAVHVLADLSRRAVGGDAAALASLSGALSAGALSVAFQRCASVSAALEAESEVGVSGALAEMSALADLVSLLSCNAVFPQDRAHPISAPAHLRALASAAASMLRDAASELEAGSTRNGEAELDMSVRLLCAFNFFELHAMTDGDVPDDAYVNEFAEPAFLGACCRLLNRFPRTQRAVAIAQVFHFGTNYKEFCVSLVRRVAGIDAVKSILEALSSTIHDDKTMGELLSAAGNCAGDCSGAGDWLPLVLLEKGALDELQPAVLSSSLVVSVDAAYTITGLLLRKEAAELMSASGAVDTIKDMLRTVPPGSVRLPHTQWGSNDVANIVARLRLDAPAVVQLACLHCLAATTGRERNMAIIGGPRVSGAIRACAASEDPFVFSAVVYLLRLLNMPLPTYRVGRSEQAVIPDVKETPLGSWSIANVCAWVNSKPFACYRGIFRDGMVCGSVLASITDADLEANGISQSLHRRAILFAVKELVEAGAAGGGGGGASASSPGGAGALARAVTMPRPMGGAGATTTASGFTYDVFISYRRAGGADFAHLVKLHLKSSGYESFLDVENLGTGSFADALDASMRASRNVILVWTKGCMDRFLDESDSGNGDFVRREYALALNLKKNMIPFYKDDFVFPTPTSLPADVRGVLSQNAIPYNAAYREASFEKLKGALILS